METCDLHLSRAQRTFTASSVPIRKRKIQQQPLLSVVKARKKQDITPKVNKKEIINKTENNKENQHPELVL